MTGRLDKDTDAVTAERTSDGVGERSFRRNFEASPAAISLKKLVLLNFERVGLVEEAGTGTVFATWGRI